MDDPKHVREVIDLGNCPVPDDDEFGVTAPPQSSGFGWLRFNQKNANNDPLPVRFRLGDIPKRYAKHSGKDKADAKFCPGYEFVRYQSGDKLVWQMQSTNEYCPLCEKTRLSKDGKTIPNFPSMVMLARGLERKPDGTSVAVKIELKASMRSDLEMIVGEEGDPRCYDLKSVMAADGHSYKLMKVGDKTPLTDQERGMLNELGEDWQPEAFAEAMITKFKEEIANGTTAK